MAWITHSDNVFYQAELGLMDDSTLQAALEGNSRVEPIWEELGIDPGSRIRKFLEEHKSGT